MKVRLPPDLKAFVVGQATRNSSTQNSEIVRAIRERMERTKPATGESLQAHPAAGPNETACQGGPIHHG
ncbi:hypothetical protein [Methylobacterium gnaphalii]|nr:hypothetical protein [Methylobacterium gnaphalii]GJD69915.1 hypothetical protein MMMDOFMJ_2854 [Methylobacterium gnaphalii]